MGRDTEFCHLERIQVKKNGIINERGTFPLRLLSAAPIGVGIRHLILTELVVVYRIDFIRSTQTFPKCFSVFLIGGEDIFLHVFKQKLMERCLSRFTDFSESVRWEPA